MPTWLLASWKARSIQKRCACICASLFTLVCSSALLKVYLIVAGEFTSRRTIRCQRCALGPCLSQSHTCRWITSTRRSPRVVSRNVCGRHAEAGCFCSHLRTPPDCPLLSYPKPTRFPPKPHLRRT